MRGDIFLSQRLFNMGYITWLDKLGKFASTNSMLIGLKSGKKKSLGNNFFSQQWVIFHESASDYFHSDQKFGKREDDFRFRFVGMIYPRVYFSTFDSLFYFAGIVYQRWSNASFHTFFSLLICGNELSKVVKRTL